MPLTRVTITGADDGVDVKALLALSLEFPFVEWAILFSHKHAGRKPRYPSPAWLTALEWWWGPELKTALHLCGTAAVEVMAQPAPWLEHTTFDRVQFNGWAPGLANVTALGSFAREHQREFILQARSEESLQAAADDAKTIGGASVLFDPSGGTGRPAFNWPGRSYPHWMGDVRLGYAGGIRPETVVGVAKGLIEARAFDGDSSPFWIDMESGVRDEQDRFDLGRVRAVLEAAAPFVTEDHG